MARSLSPDLLQAARPVKPSSPTYLDDLLERYKALLRQSSVTPLSPQQERELAEVRQELQAISRQDERAQSAARQMKEVNASLGALEAQVDARIAQREAEQRGETGQPA